jgi:hypothetical protein
MKKLLLIFLLLMGCTTLGTEFNDYQKTWVTVSKPTTQAFNILAIVKVRGFGIQKDKQDAFLWGKTTSGAAVSTNPPQIFIDVREDGQGNIMIPPHILGHELIHILRLQDKRILDPDSFRNME